jgi:metallo-beta-lactamase class B
MPTVLSRRAILKSISATALTSLATPLLHADLDPDWTTPAKPHRIADNLYYVGSRDLAAFLITTTEGLILINSNLETSPPQIRAAIEKVGYHYKDIKILLISHAHYDHCAGSAQIVRETGAKYMVMDADVPEVEAGGRTNFRYANDKSMWFPPAKVSWPLHNGQQVKLGNAVLTAHKTAGHTKGCTTWTMQVTDKGKSYNAVIVGSPNVLSSYNLINDPKYPNMAADFTRQFQTLKSLPCEIFLGAHGGYYDMLEKSAKLTSSTTNPFPNPFLDPEGYKAYIADRQQAFEIEFARQRAKVLSPLKREILIIYRQASSLLPSR